MAVETKGFRVSDELKNKINATISASGLNDMNWIEQVTNLWIMQEAKVGLPNFSQDISELELHTKRINELVLNMIQRCSHEKDDVQRHKNEIHDQNVELTQQLELCAKEIKTLLADREEDREHYEKEKEEAGRLVRQMEGAAEHNILLINEYRDKNDTLTGLISEYKAGYEQSIELKNEVNRLNQIISGLEAKLEESNNAIRVLENSHKENVERVIERKSVEKERELLQIKTEHQAKIQSLNEESTRKIQSLYERIEQLRNDHQADVSSIKEAADAQIKSLSQRLEQALERPNPKQEGIDR